MLSYCESCLALSLVRRSLSDTLIGEEAPENKSIMIVGEVRQEEAVEKGMPIAKETPIIEVKTLSHL
ncbi:hypothetical protein VNO78_15054 [Psophocarpus tetragonolobus]|uniref:Uncharacterized protein n=1 Tax=Psophocarpus tetragonolobus TaxID=3891 RepID=A0AAN9SFS5_PSOTE